MAGDDPTTRSGRVVSFYSYAGGVGRTGSLANVALILASAGNRVLVVDLDVDSPSLHRYLSAFVPPGVAPLAVEPVRLSCRFDSSGSIDLLGATTDPGPNAAAARFSPDRAALLSGGHDYVLIDCPAGISERSRECVVDLPDIVVLGFALNVQAIDGGARRIQALDGRRPIRVLPVPMHVDQRAAGKAARMWSRVHAQLAPLLTELSDSQRRRYWQEIPIPYEPDYAAEEGLAVLDAPGPQRDELVQAYARLTSATPVPR